MKNAIITPEEARLPPGELALWCQLRDLGGWERQYPLSNKRIKFDFAHPTLKLLVEVDGGSGGQAHGTPWGREHDYRKRNDAVCRGWRVLIGSTKQAENGELLMYVRRAMGGVG